MSEDCWIHEPGNAKQITVNAGVVNVTAACEGFDFFDSNNTIVNVHYLSLHFDALAGHEYGIKRYRATFRLHDMTVKQKIKHCAKSKDRYMLYQLNELAINCIDRLRSQSRSSRSSVTITTIENGCR